jgi:hypothetical protein
MRVAEILNETVTKVDFSKGKGFEKHPDIEIPSGYDRFEVDGKKIIGVKGDTRVTVSATSDPVLAQELVRVYNGGKSSMEMKPLTMTQAFGSDAEEALEDAGIQLTEKPDSWKDFEEGGYYADRNIHQIMMKKIDRMIGPLKTWTGKEVFGTDRKPTAPLASTKITPADLGEVAIVSFSDGTRYLVATSGARTYIRFWQKIDFATTHIRFGKK